MPENKMRIIFTPKARARMFGLVTANSNEVAWHGTVDRISDTEFIVDDILLYPQKTTVSTVKVDDKEYAEWLMSLPDEVCCRLRFQAHSHVNAPVTPSSVDLDQQYSIVKQLSGDDYYIFMIINKRFEVNVRIYDLKTGRKYGHSNIDLVVMNGERQEMHFDIDPDMKKCLYREDTDMLRKERESEKELWQEARERLNAIYGDHPPLSFLSRLDAEEVLLRGSGMIRHLKLLGKLWEKGVINNYPFNSFSTLTGWLLNATPVNPLEPHTVCPRCRRTVLHPEVIDGWDLPEEKCPNCGETLRREGHDIRPDLLGNKMTGINRNIIASFSEHEESILWETVREVYGDDWKIKRYRMIPQDENSLWASMKKNDRTYVLLPADAAVPFRETDGVIRVPEADYYMYHILEILESVMYIDVLCGERTGGQEPQEEPPRLSLNDLLKDDILAAAKEHCRKVTGIVVEYNEETGRSGMTSIPYFTGPGPGYAVKERFEDEDISAFLPDRFKFSLLMKVLFASESMNWFPFWRKLIRGRKASFGDVPASEEDLYEMIRRMTENAGIHDRGIPMKALDCVENTEPDGHTLSVIRELGAEGWLADFFEYAAGNYFSIDSKEERILQTHSMLYGIVYRKKMGIDEEEYLRCLNAVIDDEEPEQVRRGMIEGRYVIRDAIRDKTEALGR